MGTNSDVIFQYNGVAMWRVAEKRLRTQSIFVEKYLSYILYRLQINEDNKFTRRVQYDLIFM